MSEAAKGVRYWLRRPVVTSTAFFAAGAALATAIIGSPRLWSPEAAGWAAAIGTLAAAMAAVYVGLEPSRQQRQDHRRRARAIGVIVYARLARQQLILDAARRIFEGSTDRTVFRVVAPNLSADTQFADPLIPYFDALDDMTASSIAAAVADMESGAPFLVYDESDAIAYMQANRLAVTLRPMVASMDRARIQLGSFALSGGPEEMEASVQKMVEGFHGLATALREAEADERR